MHAALFQVVAHGVAFAGAGAAEGDALDSAALPSLLSASAPSLRAVPSARTARPEAPPAPGSDTRVELNFTYSSPLVEGDVLEARLNEGQIQELILATGTTVEGEATAHYVLDLAREAGVSVTRIAQGVPMGGDLEFVDGATLAQALRGRRPFSS